MFAAIRRASFCRAAWLLIGDPSFQATIKRAIKTTANIRSNKKAAKITVSRMVRSLIW
jgi:hypothetical protein